MHDVLIVHKWEKVFLGICSIWWREEEGKISRWNSLSYTRHVTYLNLIGQTNGSIKFVPGTSQPHRNITCVPRLDINYINMLRHNVWFLINEHIKGSVRRSSWHARGFICSIRAYLSYFCWNFLFYRLKTIKTQQPISTTISECCKWNHPKYPRNKSKRSLQYYSLFLNQNNKAGAL